MLLNWELEDNGYWVIKLLRVEHLELIIEH